MYSQKHTCLFYTTQEELIDILVPYFKAGLENNELCIWTIPDTMEVAYAKAALGKVVENLDYYIEKGQMVISEYKDTYLRSGMFVAGEMLEFLVKKEKEVLEKGYSGMRGAGDDTWALENNWLMFLYYEAELNKIIERLQIKALCSYRIDKLDINQIVDIGLNHNSSVVKRLGNWGPIEPAKFEEIKRTLR